MNNENLLHYGIKRRSGRYPWGSGERPYQSTSPKNTKRIDNYKGPLYFISEKDLDGKQIQPRVPDNYFTKNNYEDSVTKRICFSDDVGKCLIALSQNNTGKVFNVYTPSNKVNTVYKPNTAAVPDSDITGELWVLDPTILRKVGSIKCLGDDNLPGIKFQYGDREAELYGWKYKWIKHRLGGDNIMDLRKSDISPQMKSFVNNNELLHFGIKRKSGRYPWGSGERPYQSSGGKKIIETKEQREKRKQKTLQSPKSAKDIKEFASELSYKELDDVLKRLELNQKLDKYVKAEKDAGIRKINDALEKLKVVSNAGEVTVKTMNNLNGIIDMVQNIPVAAKGRYDKYQQYSSGSKSNIQQKDQKRKK